MITFEMILLWAIVAGAVIRFSSDVFPVGKVSGLGIFIGTMARIKRMAWAPSPDGLNRRLHTLSGSTIGC